MFTTEALNEGHDLQSFDCGTAQLNDWFKNSARNAQAQGTSRTWVLCTDSEEVAGYYSLAAHAVEPAELSRSMGGNARTGIPAVLLAKLALDVRYQGLGNGGRLLACAMEHVAETVTIIGARFLVVDAIDEKAADFYSRYGFTPTPNNPHRLIQRIHRI